MLRGEYGHVMSGFASPEVMGWAIDDIDEEQAQRLAIDKRNEQPNTKDRDKENVRHFSNRP